MQDKDNDSRAIEIIGVCVAGVLAAGALIKVYRKHAVAKKS